MAHLFGNWLMNELPNDRAPNWSEWEQAIREAGCYQCLKDISGNRRSDRVCGCPSCNPRWFVGPPWNQIQHVTRP